MDESLDDFFAENPLKSKLSRERYSYLLKTFSADASTETCTPGSILKWLDTKNWGDSTRYLAVTVIRKYVRWKHGEDHPALRLKTNKGEAKPRKALTPSQLQKLVQFFDTSTARGKRNIAIVYLAVDTGFRVAELSNLKAADIDFDERVALVKVKGGGWGRGLFSLRTAYMLDAWMPHRKANDPRLFQISRDGLRVTVRRWGERLGFHLHPHLFKHTGATNATKLGAPSRVLQEAFRWKKLEQAEAYTQDISAEDFTPYFGTNILD